jgi:hypothetical protein
VKKRYNNGCKFGKSENYVSKVLNTRIESYYREEVKKIFP